MLTDTELLTALGAIADRLERLARDYTDGHGFQLAHSTYMDVQVLRAALGDRVEVSGDEMDELVRREARRVLDEMTDDEENDR